jgi:signal transduction histidine kinase
MLLALLWRFISRAPGWQDTRPLAIVCATAALYSLCDFTQVMSFSPGVTRWAGQVSIALAGLHCGAWLLFLEARDRRPLVGFERIIAWSGVVLGALALMPGVLFTERLSAYTVDWLGVTYQMPEPSPLGTWVVLYFLGAMGAVAVRVYRRWSSGWRWRAPAIGGLFLVALGVNDALAISRVIDSPLLVDIGFLVVNVTYGLTELNRLVLDARRIEQLSTHLEGEVQARTAELAAAHQALARAEKLAAIGRLAGGVAHELNNPTAVVLSNLGYVRRGLCPGGAVPDDATDALDDATAATERIARVVRNLSDAGRVASHSGGLPEHSCEVSEVVRQAFEVLRRRPGAPELRLEGLPNARARFDEALLERVLLSVLENAAAAVEAVPSPQVAVELGRDGLEVQLIVSDNGPGVAAGAEARLFEPFFSTKPQGRGIGLGLAVAKGLMHAQGGDLRFLGSSSRGARFLLALPIWSGPEGRGSIL